MKLLLILAFSLFFCSVGTGAAEKITAVSDPWPPYLGPDLPESGFAVELVRAAFKTQGYEVKMDFTPWIRALNGVKSGRYDILIASWWTKKRSKTLKFSDHYLSSNIKFIKRAGDAFEYTGLDSLSGKVVGVIRGYGYSDAFWNADNFQRYQTSELKTNLKILNAKRIDLTLEDEIVARSIIARQMPHLKDQFSFTENSLLSQTMHVTSGLSNPKHGAIIAAFNKGLDIIRKNGTFEIILKKHGFNLYNLD